MSLHRKIVVFQWILGFLGAWAIMVSVSSLKEDTSPTELVQARQVETIEILKDKNSLSTLKPLKQLKQLKQP